MSSELLEEAVLKRADWIDSVLISGVILCATLALIQYRHKKTFKLLDIEFPVTFFPWVCIAYTTAHLYVTWLFSQICFAAGSGHMEIWQALTKKGPLIFAGMLPRTPVFRLPLPLGGNIVLTRISLADPTTWLFYGFCCCLFLAFTSSAKLAHYSTRKRVTLVVCLLFLNWTAGSLWSYSASLMAQ